MINVVILRESIRILTSLFHHSHLIPYPAHTQQIQHKAHNTHTAQNTHSTPAHSTHSTHSLQLTAHNSQLTAYSTQHTAHSTHSTHSTHTSAGVAFTWHTTVFSMRASLTLGVAPPYTTCTRATRCSQFRTHPSHPLPDGH